MSFFYHYLLKFVLWTYFKLYKLIAILFIRLTGDHPKHEIIRYENWFANLVTTSDVVLDIGCKYGQMTYALSKKAHFVYGIELEKKGLDVAKSKNNNENIEYLLGDATIYDYQQLKPISVVTLSNVLEHIDNRIDFLSKLNNQLNWFSDSSKRILIRVPTIERDWIPLAAKKVGIDSRLDSTHFIEFTALELLMELRDSGINIISMESRFGEFYVEGIFI